MTRPAPETAPKKMSLHVRLETSASSVLLLTKSSAPVAAWSTSWVPDSER